MGVRLTFLGAAGTVTGSKYLVESDGKKLLVDCGMFQGAKNWEHKNWDRPPVDLGSIQAVLLTHAHLDHTGILPRYSAQGLNCPVYCTQATLALSRIILTDSGRLQEEEASYRSESGTSRHSPPLPLYTEGDALNALKKFKTVPFKQRVEVLPGVFAEWSKVGHILGASAIRLEIGGRTLCFSGDLGRYEDAIMDPPEGIALGDLLLIESTYGDREHPKGDQSAELAAVINETADRGGCRTHS